MPSSKSRAPTTARRPQPAAVPPPAPRGDWLPLCLLAVVTLLAFSPVLTCDFVNLDDEDYVTHNASVRAGLTAASWRWAWTTNHAANWHPLTWLSLMLDAQLYGQRAWGFHLSNLLWHTANVLLLFVLLRSLTGALWRSFLVAGLFALHPLHVESVAWVSERKDVLSTFFGLLAVLAYARYAAAPSLWRYLAVACCMMVSLLAKPMWVTLPFLLLLLDYWPLRRWRPAHKPEAPARGQANPWLEARGPAGQPVPADNGPSFAPASLGRLVLEKLPLLLLAVLMSAVTFVVQQHGGALRNLDQATLVQRLAHALLSYAAYLGQTLWPVDLAAFYPYRRSNLTAEPLTLAGLVLAAITVVALRHRRQQPYLIVGWLWYLGMLVPVIGLVQVGSQVRADRYTYVPLIGVFIMFVWGLAELARRWQAEHAAAFAAVGALAALGLTCWMQVTYWTSSSLLWEHTLQVTGPSWHAHDGMGLALQERGDLEGARKHFLAAVGLEPDHWASQFGLGLTLDRQGRPGEALPYLAEAARLNPQGSQIHNALGAALLKTGNVEGAIAELEQACALAPGVARFHANLGMALFEQGRLDAAAGPLQEAIRLNPNFAPAHHLLGLSAQLREDWPGAEASFRRTVELRPSNPAFHRGLAYALARQGRSAEAQAEYQESLKLDETWPATVVQKVWGLAADPDPRKRQGRLAVQEAEKAVQALGGAHPLALDALAAAYAETGRFPEAAATARRAAAEADAVGKSELARAIRDRLRLYEQGKPFRGPPP
jgi:Flp pilus assembly protein TadD